MGVWLLAALVLSACCEAVAVRRRRIGAGTNANTVRPQHCIKEATLGPLAVVCGDSREAVYRYMVMRNQGIMDASL